MEKTYLPDLRKKLFIRTTLLSLNGINELLSINEGITGDEVFLEIVKKALREFEQTTPLILESFITKSVLGSCYSRPGYGEIKSNFTSYLKCLIDESQIILVPNAIPAWRCGGTTAGNTYYTIGSYASSYPQPLSYTYVLDYNRPYLFIDDLPPEFILRYITSRPIIPDWESPEQHNFNEKSGKSAIYWLNVEDGGARGTYFVDLCLVHLLDYVRQLKASISLPNMPVDLFSNVDASYQELRSRCDQYALQSGWYGDLLL